MRIQQLKEINEEIIKLDNDIDKDNDDDGLNIFLIPHSHCDFGWINTVDEYYNKQVDSIITTVIKELLFDENKKFNWAEVGYFKRWYENQNDIMKNVVKGLVLYGQLEFVTGGWVQNDEASSNIDDIIEQMTQGQQWLKENLNFTIQYGWQIDSFGYSSITPTLYSKMNIQGLLINRVPNDVRTYMKENKEMEFIWKGSSSLSDSELLVSVYDIHYNYPISEIDPSEREKPISKKVSSFIDYVNKLKKTRNTNNLIIPLGDDFAFKDAESEFSFANTWITYIKDRKSEYGIKDIKFATLSDYFKQLKKDLIKKQIKIKKYEQDFFPYNTASDEYWTGYFSTRPLIKKSIRDLSDSLRVSDSLYSLLLLQNQHTPNNKLYNDIEYIRNTLSASQHHDTVTGTSRSYVLYDYLLKMKDSRFRNLNTISNLFNLILKNNNSESIENNKLSTSKINENYLFDNYINLDELNNDEIYSIKLFNSLGWNLKKHYSFKLKSNSLNKIYKLQLLDINGNQLPIQINNLNLNNNCYKDQNQYLLFTIIDLPPLGFTTYYLKFKNNNNNNNKIYQEYKNNLKKDISFTSTSNNLIWTFSKKNGLLKSIQNVKENNIITVEQSFQDYNLKYSGPYIFEDSKLKNTLNDPDYYLLYDGPLVSQLTSVFDSNDCDDIEIINQRIYKNPISDQEPLITEQYLETSFSIIGHMNKEKVIHYQIDSLKNTNEFYTDNGLESRKRIYHKGKTTSNYYPTLHYVNVKEDQNPNSNQFTIFVDRSVGTTLKPNENQIEIMVHRTLNHDDWKGVRWPSKDTSRIDSKLYLNVDKTHKENHKLFSLKIDHQPFHLIKKIKDIDNYKNQFKESYSGLIKSLPENIHLLSLKIQNNGNLGLRLLNLGYNSNELQLNQYFNSLNQFESTVTGLTFLNIDDTKQDLNDILTVSDSNFPYKSGFSEFNFNQNNQIINDNSRDNSISINSLEIKSLIINLQQPLKGNNNNDDKLSFNYDNTIYNHIMIGNNTDSPVSITSTNTSLYYVDNIFDTIYQYDFSVYPIILSHYNDIGKYNDNRLKIILLSTIIPCVVLGILIIGFVIYRKNKKSKQSILKDVKFIKLEEFTINDKYSIDDNLNINE